MTSNQQWSVTLTGELLPQASADDAWAAIAATLNLDEARLRARVPLTFKPVDEDKARRQRDKLQAAGMKAVLHEDDGGSRLWVRLEGHNCGPVQASYARQALADGVWPVDTPVCPRGGDHWQALGEHFAAPNPEGAVELEDAPSMASAEPPPVAAPVKPPTTSPEATPAAVAVPTTPPPAPAPAAAPQAAPAAAVVDPPPTAPPVTEPASAPISPPTTPPAAPPSLPPEPPHAAAGHAKAVLPTDQQLPGLHGGFWMRAGAWWIDRLIIAVVFTLLAIVAGVAAGLTLGASPSADPKLGLYVVLAVDLGALVASWLYYAICESSRWQATPGKLALGLQVCDRHGQRIGFWRASGRYFGRILSILILWIGYLLAAWTARKQALHDFLAGCCVVRKGPVEAWHKGAEPPPSTTPSGCLLAVLVAIPAFFIGIAIVAIVAAIAIPAYQNYTVRAQVAEGLTLAAPVKLAVSRHAVAQGQWPADNRAAGVNPPTQISGTYVSRVSVDHGTITLTYGAPATSFQVEGGHLVLVPQRADNQVTWQCQSPDIRAKFLPAQCR